MLESSKRGKRSESVKYDIKQQQVQNLFHRNRLFMERHNIRGGSRCQSYKKPTEELNESMMQMQNMSDSLQLNACYAKYLHNHEDFQSLQGKTGKSQVKQGYQVRDPNQELYIQKLHELVSTQQSFAKYFINSEQTMNKQIEVGCYKQKQRLLSGVVSTKNQPSTNSSRLMPIPNTEDALILSDETHRYEDHSELRCSYDPPPSEQLRNKFNTSNINDTIYPKSRSINFSRMSQRKNLF